MSNISFYSAKSGVAERSAPAMRAASVWICGEKEITSEDSFVAKLAGEGFHDFLAIGASKCGDALAYMRKYFKTTAPKYAIWNFGVCVQNFISVCKDNGVTPILTLLPGGKNRAKNAAIISCGERYIDFTKATNADMMMGKLVVDFPEVISPKIPIRIAKEKCLTKDNKISIGANRVKDGKHLVFNANVDSLLPEDKIIISHGYYMSYGRWFEISAENISLYSYTSWNETPLREQFSVPHGLDIKGNFTVIIGADNDNLGNTVTIITESGTFRKSGYGWSACDGEIFAKIDGEGVLSSANLYWTCVDYNKDIWLIGASYFSLNDPARWPYYLYADKYDKNVFMAGRGGMGGPHGIEELKDALKSGFSPKALAWGVGMNDGSDEGDIKPAYYDALCELMQVCKERDIMLYVMTIPQTPKQNNSYKLDYVMNRKGEFAKYNYRVINIARSINAHTVGSEWYEGMIHSDQTHPTTLGARSFYLQFLCDFPELMVGGSAKRVHKKVETLAVGQALSISGEGKSKDEFAVTFSADFTDEFVGKLVLGGTKNGQTYVTIDKKFVKVYAKSAEKDVLLTSVPTSAKMQDIVNVRVHVVGNKANIALASAGELLTMKKNSIFSFETYWSAGEEVTLSCEGQELQNVDMKYVNN